MDNSHILGVTSVLNHGIMGLEILLRGGELKNPYLFDFKRFLTQRGQVGQEGISPGTEELMEIWSERIIEMGVCLQEIEASRDSGKKRNGLVLNLMKLVEMLIADAFMRT